MGKFVHRWKTRCCVDFPFYCGMNSKRQKQWVVSRNIGNVFMLWDIFKPTFFYIEEVDILLGIGKEGVEMVFKQDCNQTI